MFANERTSGTVRDRIRACWRRRVGLAVPSHRWRLRWAAVVISAWGIAATCGISLYGQAPSEPRGGAPTAQAPALSMVGPQRGITCPGGAVEIRVGTDIQRVVNARPGRTTFCLKAGVHLITSAIAPKTENIFVGEYGAVLDGRTWKTTDGTQAAFLAHNQDIDYVTIRNLVIRNMPQRGIHAFYWMSDHWTIEHNEIASNKAGVVVPPHSSIRNNYIHHNVGNPSSPDPAERGGGYMAPYAHYSIFDTNEIAYNGPEQKIGESASVTFRNNYVHHNLGDGIWYDSNNTAALAEDNRVEDNGRNGIFYEISSGAIIRNNTVQRSGAAAVFISTSQNVQIYSNTLADNVGGVSYFVDCAANDGGQDLANNSAHGNTIRVGTQTGAFANGFSYAASCTPTEVAPYLNGSKNLIFLDNTYQVPSPATGQYFLWNGRKHWNEWQSLRHDVGGAISRP
jgi:parallel beta-helix repeat protein